MDLDWYESGRNCGPRYQEKTKAGVVRLLAGFKDITCFDKELMPEPVQTVKIVLVLE